MKTPLKLRLSLGSKFLALVLIALFVTIGTVVYNASRLFQKDNLDSIYLFSTLLTNSKSRETETWLDGLLRKGAPIARFENDQNLTLELQNDRDLLFVLGLSKSGELENHWWNTALAEATGFHSEAFLDWSQKFKSTPPTKRASLSNAEFDGKKLILISSLNVETQKPYVLGILATHLTKSFGESGPYAVLLASNEGQVLSANDHSRYPTGSTLGSDPFFDIVKNSKVENELQEFRAEKTDRIGAFQKIPNYQSWLLTEVPKRVALETGTTLVRRSTLIAIISLSGVFILVYLLLQGIVSPVRKLSQAARAISEGEFDVRVQVEGSDEIFDLASSFNLMGDEIKKKITNLSRISEAAKTLSSLLDPDQLLNSSLDFLQGLIESGSAVAWYRFKDAAPLVIRRDWTDGLSVSDMEAKLESIQSAALATLKGQSAILAPILEKGVRKGFFIFLRSTGAKPFQKEDLFAVTTVVSTVGVGFENISLLKETADKARLDKEIETARHVQENMFPPSMVRAGGLEIQSFYTPASECGGDWWGYADLSDGQTLIAIGDATGHGLPAAMVTAAAKASCSVITALSELSHAKGQVGLSPGEIMSCLNRAVYESTAGKILMTFFLGILDSKTGRFQFSSASHDAVYLYRMPLDETARRAPEGSRERLDVLNVKRGSRLGQAAQAQYEVSEVTLKPGDLITLYTDGLTEGLNAQGKEYSEQIGRAHV
jgi:HAMP domain-containing protein